MEKPEQNNQSEQERNSDQSAKIVLSDKEVLAWILHCGITEYADYSVQEIANELIEGQPHTDIPVDRVSAEQSTAILGRRNEDNDPVEGTVVYDVLFDAILPHKDGEMAEPTRFIINLEAQNNPNPGYPLTKRGVYYCSRLIASQKGKVFTKQNYGAIHKVFSIWICTNPPEEKQNSIYRIGLKGSSVHGNAQENPSNYDLMEIIMVYLGKVQEDNYKLLRMLNAIFRSESTEQTKAILTQEFGFQFDSKVMKEVDKMSSYSEGVKARWREEGLKDGRIEGRMEGRMEGRKESCITFVRNLIQKGFSLDDAMETAAVPDDFREEVLAAVQQ